MIYLHYKFKWKDYQSLKNLSKETKSDFELKYDSTYISTINEQFYSEFLRNNDYVATISHITDSTIEIYVAVGIRAIDGLNYEKKLKEILSDCELIKKREVTIKEFKRELLMEPYDLYSNRRLIEKLQIDYKESFFNPYAFKLEEEIFDTMKITKDACKKRAKEILASKSMYEEIDRIYSEENQKIYLGHPVHYIISAGDWGAAEDIYKLLISALASNNRLVSNRIEIMRDIKKGAYSDERYKQVINAAEGGTVIIELKSEDGMGRFATDFHEFTKLTGLLMEKQKKDTLFIFVEVTGKSIKDEDALNNILTKADMIQITEGTGNYQDASNYLMELVGKADFHVENKSDVLDFLPEAELYSVTDIFNAYNAWYGSGLKNHVYKAYKEKKSFKIEITKVENKPYDELQEMIGLAEVKKVVDQIIAASKVLRVRERMGLNTGGSSLHMMFSGNPGTAKTTVARLLAKILKEEDAIESGRFVECGRQDLVGKYVGWTAHIVEEKFKKARKLVKLSSKNFLRHCPFVSETTGTVHSKITGVYKNSRIDEKNVFINLKKIEEAIQDFGGKGGKIGFHFYGYDEKKELIPRKNADGSLRWYIIDPYYILLYNGKYYLVGALDGYDNVSFYRMDLMFDLTTKPRESIIKDVDPLTGEIKRVKAPRRKTVEIKGLPNKWDSKTASKFQAQHLYMYYGDVEEIALKVDRERYTLIHDYWGENYTFIKHIDEKYDEVVLECVPEAMEVWALQCSDCVEVLTPQNLRNRIKEKCEKLAAKYGKTL